MYTWENLFLIIKLRIIRISITKTLAPPLRISADDRDIIMSTVDSLLVWDRATKHFRGEFGPDIDGFKNALSQLNFFIEY